MFIGVLTPLHPQTKKILCVKFNLNDNDDEDDNLNVNDNDNEDNNGDDNEDEELCVYSAASLFTPLHIGRGWGWVRWGWVFLSSEYGGKGSTCKG